MKRYFPVISLFLIILADAFLKSYIRDSVSTYSIIATSALIILFLSSAYLFRHFRKSSSSFWENLTSSEQNSRSLAIVFVVLLIAAFFRLWKLDNLFDGLFWDEAYKGLDGIAIRDFGERP